MSTTTRSVPLPSGPTPLGAVRVPPSPRERVLTVVADRLRHATVAPTDPLVPEWVVRWCRRTGWDLRHHPGTGPAAAAAAAALADRVLVLRTGGATPDDHRRHVVCAVHRLPDDAAVVADAAASAAGLGARLTVVHAVPRSFAERSVGLAAALTRGRQLLDAAVTRAAAHEPGLPVDCRLLRVRPHELVGEALHADLLVVGGARPGCSGNAAAGPGLVAHSALHHAPCPVLLAPR
jgi:nucleotide-binding universal stress UspA family protein